MKTLSCKDMTPTDLRLIAVALNMQHVKMSVPNTCEHLLSPLHPWTSAVALSLLRNCG